MMSKKPIKRQMLLAPSSSILFVDEKKSTVISPESLTVERVGEKAFGLSCLPKLWTPQFIVVSADLLFAYKKCRNAKRENIIKNWSKQIRLAVLATGINKNDAIIVRSSGCSEGLKDRGKLYSEQGMLRKVEQPLKICLDKLISDNTLNEHRIPLVIQKYISPISAKGHLSNERRCYEEKRDWLGEFEDVSIRSIQPFQINLRNWRKKLITSNLVNKKLVCNLSTHVYEILKIPAAWVYEQNLRLHFEWVWDGKIIYLVQADQEHEIAGIDPTKVFQQKLHIASLFKPTCLKKIEKKHGNKYNKIKNVFIYKKLGLPIVDLYVLDDQSVINNLAAGQILPQLKRDIQELVKGSLVIRRDIATKDSKMRQLLPRTHEVRDFKSALEWLINRSAEIKKQGIKENLAFIFHKFIPAAASAFAYAAPGERKVQIEALWGLPEGLYYNAHDKYIVDTQNKEIKNIRRNDLKRFEIIAKPNFKRFFVSPDENGRWTTKILKPPFDWRRTIQKEIWIQEMALESRRIAEDEGNSVSIMWFVDVMGQDCKRKIFPWHHEQYDPQKANKAQTHRTKTPFDKSLVIRTRSDIEALRQEAETTQSSVRRIRIQPCEDELLRNKNTLRDIGKLSKKIDAVILLEGGVLSHAYYQLLETNAIVEVLHPFGSFEDTREFNKLVRDKVSSNIEKKGEVVNKAKLSGEFLLRALREKLIEEAFEVLDAIDRDSMINELADVEEIIDGIISHIKVNKRKLAQTQKEKRKKAGGFKKGIVLLKTQNPLPTKKNNIAEDSLFDKSKIARIQKYLPIDEQKIIELGHAVDKQSDKRKHPAATEVKLSLLIPMARDSWVAETPETIIDSNFKNGMKAKIIGKRRGSKIQIELSVFIKEKQPELFDLK